MSLVLVVIPGLTKLALACPVLDTGESSAFLDSRWSLPRTLTRGGNDTLCCD